MRSTEVGDIQAMDVTTPDSQQQGAPQDIQAMDISSHQMINWFQGTSKSWAPTNTLLNRLLGEHSTQLLMGHEGCKVQQPAPQLGGSVQFNNIPTTTLSCFMKKTLMEFSALPLISVPHHLWQTWITVLKQARK